MPRILGAVVASSAELSPWMLLVLAVAGVLTYAALSAQTVGPRVRASSELMRRLSNAPAARNKVDFFFQWAVIAFVAVMLHLIMAATALDAHYSLVNRLIAGITLGLAVAWTIYLGAVLRRSRTRR